MDLKQIVIDYIDTEYDEKLNDELMQWKNNIENNEHDSIISLSRSNSDSDHSGSQYSRNSIDTHKRENEKLVYDVLISYIKCKKSMYLNIYNMGRLKINIFFGGQGIVIASSIIIAQSFSGDGWVVYLLICINIVSAILCALIIFNNMYVNCCMSLMMSNYCGKILIDVENMQKNAYIDMMENKITDIENKMDDFTNSCVLFVPPVVKKCYSIVYFGDVFDILRKIRACKKRASIKLSTIRREILTIMKGAHTELSIIEKNRIHYLGGLKETAKKERMFSENAYVYICELLAIENNRAAEYFDNYQWMYKSPIEFTINHSHKNQVVDEYLQSVIL